MPHRYSCETLAALKLALLPGIGPRTMAALLERFGTAGDVLAATREQLSEVPRVGPKVISAVRNADAHVDVDAILAWCESHAVRIVAAAEADYPQALQTLPDAPPILFVRGNLELRDRLAIGIVGTRHATQYGLNEAARFARELARAGVTVVSGMARGIDGAAHRGALEAGGRTIAVLGGGLGQLYPPEHVGLADEIAAAGAVLSEYAPEAVPKGPMFPQRNRLISGLSLGVLVIEAADRSGSLITARHAAEQGREVFALPGPVTSRVSRGCHALIRDGARLVTSVDDILEELGPVAEAIPTDDGHQVRQPGELLLNDQERTVLEAIDTQATSIDALTRQSGLPIHRVLSTISVLETRRLIRRLSGQYVARL
ncbi:DNA-processing protein DprA [Candidatus Laterigemmans baculatus]|uniref:DNA-processing protein DprA n=1 Tax=Candidatus Laterigemmans baculatus TaxID=2770505 RepID=UPI001F254D95|nr:DNA-processing protein DprA [Candidatus Laterigemmans baculatus]